MHTLAATLFQTPIFHLAYLTLFSLPPPTFIVKPLPEHPYLHLQEALPSFFWAQCSHPDTDCDLGPTVLISIKVSTLHICTSGLLSLTNSLKSWLDIDLLPWERKGHKIYSINTCHHSFGHSLLRNLYVLALLKLSPSWSIFHFQLRMECATKVVSLSPMAGSAPALHRAGSERTSHKQLRLWTWDVLVCPCT